MGIQRLGPLAGLRSTYQVFLRIYFEATDTVSQKKFFFGGKGMFERYKENFELKLLVKTKVVIEEM